MVFLTTELIPAAERKNDVTYLRILESNRNQKSKFILSLLQMIWYFIRYRPDIVVTTGASPGLSSVIIGKLFRVKTIWLDSIANSEELSWSGKIAGKFADIWLTQWESLESSNGPLYKGRVL